MSHMTSTVQVLNVTKWEYSPFNSKLGVTLTVFSLATLVLSVPGYTQAYVDRIVLLMLALTFVCQWHFYLNVTSEMCAALNIRMFRVKETTTNKVELTEKFLEPNGFRVVKYADGSD